MIHDNLLLIISLLFVVSMLTMLAEKIGISYPIFLVLAGLAIGIIPGLPHLEMEPDLIFLIFLPPLLYEAAWNTSWKDFWSLRRPILLLSIGLVIFTATAVAYTSAALIPGFTLALGFVLGGVVSPPDAVAATSVLHGLKIPKRVVTILEGESLVNDASSLIVFRVALATVSTGQFHFWRATGDFFMVAGMGILIGLAIAHVLYLVHRFFPTTPSIDVALTFISPYLMYIGAEHFHYSGVLAVVSGGLFLSFRSHELFSYQSRMQTVNVWQTVIFLLNGIVFIMIGLQLPEVVNGLGQYSMKEVIFYAVVISLVTIVIRIIWVYPATYIPRLLFRSIREKEGPRNPRTVFIVAWAGMRGVVSLASALSVPLMLNDSQVFPYRDLILFITFVVILFTLVFQGMTLPLIIKWLKVQDDGGNIKEQNALMNSRLATVSLDFMKSNYEGEIKEFEPFRLLKERYEKIIEMAENKMFLSEDESHKSSVRKYRAMLLEIIDVKRIEIQKLKREHACGDDLIKTKERELDLEEARLRRSP